MCGCAGEGGSVGSMLHNNIPGLGSTEYPPAHPCSSRVHWCHYLACLTVDGDKESVHEEEQVDARKGPPHYENCTGPTLAMRQGLE